VHRLVIDRDGAGVEINNQPARLDHPEMPPGLPHDRPDTNILGGATLEIGLYSATVNAPLVLQRADRPWAHTAIRHQREAPAMDGRPRVPVAQRVVHWQSRRVPQIDDENTLSIMWHFSRVPRDREPFLQNCIPTWQGPIADPATGRWITSHVMNQDFVTWVGQGRIADRSQEYLAPSDRGIVMIRRRFLDDLKAIAEGRDPKAVIRDPAVNRAIVLPVAEREAFIEGFTRAELMSNPLARRGLQGYIFQTGQPADTRAAFLAAMGFTEEEATADPRPFDPLAPASR
jgi:hypothetical protein